VSLRAKSLVKDNLSEAVSVTQINKDATAMVAPGVDPPKEYNFAITVFETQLSTAVCALELINKTGHVNLPTRTPFMAVLQTDVKVAMHPTSKKST
jgi:hypothetical protein